MSTSQPKRRITDYYHVKDGVVVLNPTSANGTPIDVEKFEAQCAELERLLAERKARLIAEGKWPPQSSRLAYDRRNDDTPAIN